MILKELIYNEEYARKVLPFIKSDYFTDRNEKTLYNEIESFLLKYNASPTHEALVISINQKEKLKEEEVKGIVEILEDVNSSKDERPDNTWLIDSTEKFCQEKALYNAILESISILDNKTSKTKGSIPQILSDALAVSFDPYVGHDYLDDYEKRYDFYHTNEKRFPFDLDFFNKITRGGLPGKTLAVILAGTGVGKSLAMCHFAAAYMTQGFNVLYITMEMAEEKIAERIDTNLLDVNIDDLVQLPKEIYTKRIEKLREKTPGKLIIKEYPTASASVVHFRNLLNELHLKRNFKADIIFIDYLNICSSSRVKPSGNINSYMYIKMIAEELRGLAVEYKVPIITATQTTRSGYENSDPDLTDTSESFGLPATADFMVALVSTEQLESMNQIMVKQLKNRYSDPTKDKRFVIGIDRSKMKLYNVAESEQRDIADSGQTPVMDKIPFGKKSFDANKFRKLKV